MAKLLEYQSKALLRDNGIAVPRGRVVKNPEEARLAAIELGGQVVLKIQAYTTGRAGIGGIRFAENGEEAAACAAQMLGMRVKNFPVDRVLVEEKLSIAAEYYAGFIIDDVKRCVVLIFASQGGTGIEELAATHPEKVGRLDIDVARGLKDYEVRNLIRRTGISGDLQQKLAALCVKLYNVARRYEARAAEINPLVLLSDGSVAAADCRLTVDDYAVPRHPELRIEIAREFDRPPTPLDKIAYRAEAGDYRGTFYFLQMEWDLPADGQYVGFHGAGGGGSMMSMDAVLNEGFKIANFCDTSGNPPASKVYRAAKVILSQPNIVGYFGSGSGVASQEQFYSARGLLKAFLEERITIPAVVRLGGNGEEKAIEILSTRTKKLPAPVECYGRDTTAKECAQRLRTLVDATRTHWKPPTSRPSSSVTQEHIIETMTGRIHVDHALCESCQNQVCVPACKPDILKIENRHMVLSISPADAKKGKCIECLACEQECMFQSKGAIWIELPVSGLEEHRKEVTVGDTGR